MSWRTLTMGMSGVAALAVLAGLAAQPAKDKDKPRGPDAAKPPAQKDAAQPADDPMMAAMLAAAQPGEAHKVLNAFEGEWKGTVTFWEPGSDAGQTSEGKMHSKWALGGRWLRQEWHGEFMGMPFEGLGYWGYDNVKKQYVSTWMDSMSTGMMLSTGSYDAGTKTFTLTGSFTDPMGAEQKAREIIKVVSADKHVFEMWGAGPDGKDFKMMEIVYTRPGRPDAAGDRPRPGR